MLLIMTKVNVSLRFSPLNIWESVHTGKNIKSTKNSAVHDYMSVCNNVASFEDFSVLADETNDFRIKLQHTAN